MQKCHKNQNVSKIHIGKLKKLVESIQKALLLPYAVVKTESIRGQPTVQLSNEAHRITPL